MTPDRCPVRRTSWSGSARSSGKAGGRNLSGGSSTSGGLRGEALHHSPLLAYVYLHYVFDLWVQAWRQKRAHGDMIIVRFADDIVLGFQEKSDAEQFRVE